MWSIASSMLILFFLPPLWGSLVYTNYDIQISAGDPPPDLDIELAGCDVHVAVSENYFAV